MISKIVASLRWLYLRLRHLYAWLNREQKFYAYLLGLMMLATLSVAVLVYFFPLSEFDIEFSEEVQEHQFPLLDALMYGVSWFGNGVETLVTVAIACATLFIAKMKRAAWLTLATLLATPLILGLKTAFGRPRPTEDLVRTLYAASYESFPSGHVLYYTLLFGFILFLSFRHPLGSRAWNWVVRLLLSGLILAVAFSRIYLGAHWATDVIAGYLIGASLLIGWCRWYAKGNAEPA